MRDILSIYLDRIEHLEERLAEARAETDKYKRLCEGLKTALESIAKNSCCHPCREAGLWAKEALAAYEEAVK